MEEIPLVDCPPTPEILPLSSTPPPSRPGVVYSSSSEEGDEPTDGRRSPPPKCAICLGKCRQRAFTNSCKHQFCFRCLLEWSKVKPECPLCKQRFFSIVYYKSMDCFEQHTVPVPSANVPRLSTRNMYHELNVFLTNSQRFTAYAIPNMTLRLQSNNDRLHELLLHQSSEVDRFIREYGNRPIPTRQDEIRWRQFIYANRLYACPLPDLNGRFRETSASFYRNNPAQMHRVLSWMHRDLLVLSANVINHVPQIGALRDLVQMHDIDSREFLARIVRLLPMENGEHFQHECVNFARSPYDIIGYDRCVQYNPRFIQRRVRNQVIISSSEEDNDDIVYLPDPPVAAGTSSTNESSNASGRAAAVGEGVNNGNGGMAGSGDTTGTSSGSNNGRGEVNIEFPLLEDIVASDEVHPVPASSALPRVPLTSIASTSVVASENILLSSSDSDDCQFVMAQKPPHLRTPDHVVDLESASDSDVVFVAEEPLDAKATPKLTRQQQQQQQESLLKTETAGTQEYNNGASTSSGYCGGGNGNGGGGSSESVASGSALRSKYYVRPRLTRYSGGMGVKSIYEATDSDDTDCDTLFNLPHGRRPTSNTANDSSSHDEVEFGAGAQRKRRKPSKKASQKQQKVSKRTSRKRRNSSVSSSSSEDDDCIASNSTGSSSSSSEEDTDSSSSNVSISSNSGSSSSSSSNSSSSSSSSSSNYGCGGSKCYRKNITVEIECGRQLRRNTAQQSRASCTARLKSDQKDSKGRSKKKRSRKALEKETKRAKEKVSESGSKSKSRRTKPQKKSQSTSRKAKHAAKASRTKSKSKSGSRGAAGRNSRGKKRTKPSSDVGEDEPSRSTPLLADEDASTRAHYVIASRPSVSPTLDVTTVDGADGGRERKLKSVIIKRCHYNKASTSRANEAIDEDGEEGMASGSVEASRTNPCTSTAIQGKEADRSTVEPAAGHTDLLKCILSSASSSSSESESEPSVTEPAQTHRSEPYQSHNPQQDWPPAETFIQQDQLQLPNASTDQQQLEVDESTTTGASESLFEPTLSWAHETVPDCTLLPEDRALSSAAASPFSSISFPPSTTSVSPSPSMSSQSLALAAVPSPLQLIESLGGGTMDSSDSPLPSSVLGSGMDAIDGTIDEMMASEVVTATATISDAPTVGLNGGEEVAEQGAVAVPCAAEPMASDGLPPVQLQL